MQHKIFIKKKSFNFKLKDAIRFCKNVSKEQAKVVKIGDVELKKVL